MVAKTPAAKPRRTRAPAKRAAPRAAARTAKTVVREATSARELVLEKTAPVRRSIKAHPRLIGGLVLGAGLVVGALLLRRFAPNQAKRLGAAAASLAITAGAPAALAYLQSAPKRIAKSKVTRDAIRSLRKTPSKIADLHLADRTRDAAETMMKRAKDLRHQLTH